MTISVLVVDDDRAVRETFVGFFDTLGYVAHTAASVSEGRQAAAAHAPDIVLVDLRLPSGSGLTLMEALRAEDPDLGIIMLTGRTDASGAIQAVRRGALDYLEKPVDLQTLDAAVTRAVELVRLRREVSLQRRYVPVGALPREQVTMMPSLERLIDLAAHNDDVPVLIVGETGTETEYVARQIHDRSVRAVHPFLEVTEALPNAISLESVLFGHERDAYVDATLAKRGLLEVADRGTVFLDEVSELTPNVQSKLFEVLEQRTFRRKGGTVQMQSEARILAATAQPLADRVRAGDFRADLYSRLQVLTIAVPPLRQRRDELSALAIAVAPKGARFSTSALRAIERYAWPGNMRELRDTLWRAALLAEGAPIEVRHLGLPHAAPAASGPLTLVEAERRTIAEALLVTDGNRVHAARLLGIARSTLLEKLKRQN